MPRRAWWMAGEGRRGRPTRRGHEGAASPVIDEAVEYRNVHSRVICRIGAGGWAGADAVHAGRQRSLTNLRAGLQARPCHSDHQVVMHITTHELRAP